MRARGDLSLFSKHTPLSRRENSKQGGGSFAFVPIPRVSLTSASFFLQVLGADGQKLDWDGEPLTNSGWVGHGPSCTLGPFLPRSLLLFWPLQVVMTEFVGEARDVPNVGRVVVNLSDPIVHFLKWHIKRSKYSIVWKGKSSDCLWA